MSGFDSFNAPYNGKDILHQTKRFTDLQREYSVGDFVSTASTGIRVYVDNYIKNVYNDEGCWQGRSDNGCYVFIVLVHGVYADYKYVNLPNVHSLLEVVDTSSCKLNDELMAIIKELEEKWKDTNLLIPILITSLMKKQETLEAIDQELSTLKSTIRVAEQIKKGEEVFGFDFFDPYVMLAKGEPLENALKWHSDNEVYGDPYFPTTDKEPSKDSYEDYIF